MRAIKLATAAAMAAAVVGGVLWFTLPGPSAAGVPTAQAAEPAKAAVRSRQYLTEAGPERTSKADTPFIPVTMSLWGRRTTYADGTTTTTVRLAVANEATLYPADELAAFVKFARQVEEKRKDIAPQKPAADVAVHIDIADVNGATETWSYNPTSNEWSSDGIELKGIVPALEKVLADIEDIQKTKPNLPW